MIHDDEETICNSKLRQCNYAMGRLRNGSSETEQDFESVVSYPDQLAKWWISAKYQASLCIH